MPISNEMARRYPADWGRRRRLIIQYRAQPMRMVRSQERRTAPGHGQPRRAYARPRFGQGAGELVAAELGGLVPVLPQPVGCARPAREPHPVANDQVASLRTVTPAMDTGRVDGRGNSTSCSSRLGNWHLLRFSWISHARPTSTWREQ